MTDSVQQATVEASSDLTWRRVAEDLMPRYMQAAVLAGSAAKSVAQQQQTDKDRLIRAGQWEDLITETFILAFTHALGVLGEDHK